MLLVSTHYLFLFFQTKWVKLKEKAAYGLTTGFTRVC